MTDDFKITIKDTKGNTCQATSADIQDRGNIKIDDLSTDDPYRSIFEKLDTNKDRIVSKDEIQTLQQELTDAAMKDGNEELTEKEAKKVLKKYGFKSLNQLFLFIRNAIGVRPKVDTTVEEHYRIGENGNGTVSSTYDADGNLTRSVVVEHRGSDTLQNTINYHPEKGGATMPEEVRHNSDGRIATQVFNFDDEVVIEGDTEKRQRRLYIAVTDADGNPTCKSFRIEDNNVVMNESLELGGQDEHGTWVTRYSRDGSKICKYEIYVSNDTYNGVQNSEENVVGQFRILIREGDQVGWSRGPSGKNAQEQDWFAALEPQVTFE